MCPHTSSTSRRWARLAGLRIGARALTVLSISMRLSGPKWKARSFGACSIAAPEQRCGDGCSGGAAADVTEHSATTRPHPLTMDVLNDIATSGPDGLRQTEPLHSIAQPDEAAVVRFGNFADIVHIGVRIAALRRPFRGGDGQTPLRAKNGVRHRYEIRSGRVLRA